MWGSSCFEGLWQDFATAEPKWNMRIRWEAEGNRSRARGKKREGWRVQQANREASWIPWKNTQLATTRVVSAR